DAEGKRRFVFPFDFDSKELKNEYTGVLDSIAQVLKANPKWKISILGHTDSMGTMSYNDTLSYERAREVADLLLARGTHPKQIFVKGYGYRKPMRNNSTEEERAKNRRVELFLMVRE